jgi:hypothetical protein
MWETGLYRETRLNFEKITFGPKSPSRKCEFEKRLHGMTELVPKMTKSEDKDIAAPTGILDIVPL